MALREGDAEHPPPQRGVGGPHRGGGPRLPPVRGPRRAGRQDPAAGVRPPTPAKRLPKALPLADVEAILEAAGAPGTSLALRDRALLEVLYGTGARISEAVGLDLDDLDHRGRAAVLLRGQGRQGTDRPGRQATPARPSRPTWCGPARAGRRSGRGTPALFLNARGGRLSRQSAWAVIVRAAERAGVDRRGLPAHPAALLRHPPARGRAPTCASCRSCSGTPR